MDDRGNLYNFENLAGVPVTEVDGTNIETGQKKTFNSEEFNKLKMVSTDEFNKVINMNRAQRREWFKDNV